MTIKKTRDCVDLINIFLPALARALYRYYGTFTLQTPTLCFLSLTMNAPFKRVSAYTSSWSVVCEKVQPRKAEGTTDTNNVVNEKGLKGVGWGWGVLSERKKKKKKRGKGGSIEVNTSSSNELEYPQSWTPGLQGVASVSLFIAGHVPFVRVGNGSRSTLRLLPPRARHARPLAPDEVVHANEAMVVASPAITLVHRSGVSLQVSFFRPVFYGRG